MSILLPDRNGYWDASDDSRLSFDMSDASLRGILLNTHGALIIGCGNPTLHQDAYSENDGANATSGRFALFGGQYSTSPGYFGLEFRSYGRASGQFPSRFSFRFRPNGGTQSTLTAYSDVVTNDNCAYVVVERIGDDYAIHLYDRLGNKTAGTPVSHDLGSLGCTLRSSAYTTYLGGHENMSFPIVPGDIRPWNTSFENFVLVEQATAIASIDDKVKAVIQGESAVSEFGASSVKVYRTLKDLSTASLSPESSATQDVYPAFVSPSNNRSIAGSPLGAVSQTISASINEQKYNFSGISAPATTGDLALSGTYIGAATSIECRVLKFSDLSEVVTWTTVESSPSGNVWSGSISGLTPDEYCVECRPGNSAATVFEGRNPWVVGYLFLIVGQSQNAIAFDSLSTGITLDSLPATAKPYVVGVNRNSTSGYMPYVIRAESDRELSDALRYAQIEWERLHPGVPVIWVEHSIPGSGVDDWQNNSLVDLSYDYFGDGSTFNDGHATDISIAIDTSKINIILSWGTNDISTVDYANKIEGYLFDTGTGFTGSGFKHLTDFYDNDFGFALTPLTRAIGVTADNFTADPVEDDYSGSASFREDQEAIVKEWDVSKPNKFVIGPSVNDMVIESVGGPHQPEPGEGQLPYIGGSPRLGARWGVAAANLISPSFVAIPSLSSTGYFNAGKTAFTVNVKTGSYGALKNADATNDVSGFEISEDGGATWNRKGFSGSYAGNTVTITKSSGDWTAIPAGDLRWRYHKGGPYSYGTNFTTEMRADIDKALYCTSDSEGGRGIPVTQKTNAGSGFAVSDSEPEINASGVISDIYLTDNVTSGNSRQYPINQNTATQEEALNPGAGNDATVVNFVVGMATLI